MKPLFICFCAVAMIATVACDYVDGSSDSGTTDVTVIDNGTPDGGNDDIAAGDGACVRDIAEQGCHNEAECGDGKHCFVPGEPNCGVCMEGPVPCTGDEECTQSGATDMVCDYPVEYTCYCDWGTTCMLKCGVTGGMVCSNPNRPECIDGHCVAKPCTSDSDCPSTFKCTGEGTEMACTRRTCTDDAGCGDCGWCVNGACYDEPGTCNYMAP